MLPLQDFWWSGGLRTEAGNCEEAGLNSTHPFPKTAFSGSVTVWRSAGATHDASETKQTRTRPLPVLSVSAAQCGADSTGGCRGNPITPRPRLKHANGHVHARTWSDLKVFITSQVLILKILKAMP